MYTSFSSKLWRDTSLYEDTEGNYVNIMQYSSLDLPILHEGTNYVRYVGNIVEHAEIIVNERWY